MRSELTRRVVTDLAHKYGGLLWLDSCHEEWAVRLFPSRNGEDWIGVSSNLLTAANSNREAGKGGIRLGTRAEQLLWYLHAEVLQQRRSEVTIADHAVAQVVWGSRCNDWPQSWRREIKQTIRSLRQVHFELLRIPTCGWEPRLGSFAAALVGFTDRTETARIGSQRDSCEPTCRLYGSQVPHGHFVVQVGPDFLSVLEGFATDHDSRGVRHYNFCKPSEHKKEELQACHTDGRTPSVHLPSRMFGPAQWAKLSRACLDTFGGVMGEVTMAPNSRRPDKHRAGNYCRLLGSAM